MARKKNDFDHGQLDTENGNTNYSKVYTNEQYRRGYLFALERQIPCYGAKKDIKGS